MEEANLLVTFDPESLLMARYEVREALREVGEESALFLHSRVHGLFKLFVAMNPKEATRRLDALCRKDPSIFRYTFHWVPVEAWCPSSIEEMSQIVMELAERIDPEDRWRMRVNKRFYGKHSTRELIEELTKHVERPKVDLENPDKTIRIEIIGEKAALSLLQPVEHFSVNDVKEEISK